MDKLIEALKEKYSTPQEALAALGLDANILKKGLPGPVSETGQTFKTNDGVSDMEQKLSRKDVLSALKPKLAKDADIKDVIDLLDRLDGADMDDDNLAGDDEDMADMQMDEDPKMTALMAKLAGKLTPEECAEIKAMMSAPEAMDEPPQTANAANADPKDQDDKKPLPAKDEEDDDMKKEKDKEAKAAMDRAIKLACDATALATEKKTIARLRDIAEAEEMVRPYVGKLTAMDSAEEVFKAALVALNVDVKDVHPSAYRAILKHLPNPNEPQRKSYAQDSAMTPTSDIYAQFPDLLN